MDKFFHQENCDRCYKKLNTRTMSWFNEETICMDCARKEDKIKQKIKDNGDDVRDYEGIGHIPNV